MLDAESVLEVGADPFWRGPRAARSGFFTDEDRAGVALVPGGDGVGDGSFFLTARVSETLHKSSAPNTEEGDFVVVKRSGWRVAMENCLALRATTSCAF